MCKKQNIYKKNKKLHTLRSAKTPFQNLNVLNDYFADKFI